MNEIIEAYFTIFSPYYMLLLVGFFISAILMYTLYSFFE